MPGMEKKDIQVECPCCDSRLEVDARTGHVVRWRRKEELDSTGKPIVRDEDWGDANRRVSGRLGTASDKFEEGLSREKKRERDLDDLFAKANDKIKKKRQRDDEGA